MLYEGLEEEQFEAAMMVVLRREVGAEWLLPRIARQLGVERADLDREAVIRQIYERLAIVHEDGRRAVLIIDDAHGLANADTLSELCGLVKLEYEDHRLVTVVLVGAPRLDEAITADPLVCHQVDVRVPISPLAREEAVTYLAARVEAAGGSADLWLPGASAALHEFADGAPGCINRLADNALYEAWIAGRAQVTRADVECAHRALGWGRLAARTLRPTPVAAERTDPLPFEESAVPDLDPELDAIFEPSAPRASGREAGPGHRTAVTDFEAAPEVTKAPLRRAQAERTPIQLDEVEEAPKGDDVDDLFMELLDD